MLVCHREMALKISRDEFQTNSDFVSLLKFGMMLETKVTLILASRMAI